jgi:hypothetical protein
MSAVKSAEHRYLEKSDFLSLPLGGDVPFRQQEGQQIDQAVDGGIDFRGYVGILVGLCAHRGILSSSQYRHSFAK